MLRDCMEVFQKELQRNTDGWLLDNYIPKDGTYVFLNLDKAFGVQHVMEIAYDSKTDTLMGKTDIYFRYARCLDYNSKLIEMNKPMDPKKVIHSNNLYTLFVKKDSLAEGKLTEEIADGYFDVIAEPEKKYTKPKAKELYERVTEELGEVDRDEVERIREWVKNWLKNPEIVLPVEVKGKNYLKLFFVYDEEDRTRQAYERENRRYLIPNIYNSNDFNMEVEGKLAGLPSNNMGMNAKKPYLENKSRKVGVPMLADMDEAVLQGKFFDYLWGQASVGRVNVYLDFDKSEIRTYTDRENVASVDSGAYLRIRKGKEVEILSADTIIRYEANLRPEFVFKNILKTREEEVEGGYSHKSSMKEIRALVDDVFFGKKLLYNFFTEPGDINFNDSTLKNILLTYRDRLFGWFYKDSGSDMAGILSELSRKIILCSVKNGYWSKVKHQLNLSWSLQDYFAGNNRMEEEMGMVQRNFKQHVDMYKEDWEFDGDGEYYYAVGQIISYFLTLSKASKKPLSMVNQFLNARDDKLVKNKLIHMFQKYNYDIDNKEDVRVKNILSHITLYEPQGEVQQDKMVAGLTSSLAFYEKKESKEEGETE